MHSSNEFKSKLTGLSWPAVSDVRGGRLATLAWQLEQTQWFSAERLWQCQERQLQELLKHVKDTVPFYKQRLETWGWQPGQRISAEQWQRLPLLTRQELQANASEFRSRSVPAAHGDLRESQTSGSTGTPVKFVGTSLTQLMWETLTLRLHLWHGYDFSELMCAIRAIDDPAPKDVIRGKEWGRPFSYLFESGPAAMMDCRVDIQKLAHWLRDENPAYLFAMPSTVEALARMCLEQGIHLPRLQKVATYAEMLSPEIRDLCHQAWDARLVDTYSCEEAGYIALQCPEHDHYHVQSESLLVEVLDDSGRPCQPGQVGRVVVTPLLNFASPLIRYELQDYAEVGEPCPCGRGLPVIRSIKGRLRNLITTPDGRRFWPVLYASVWSHIAPIRQLQLIQKSPGHFDAKVVIDRELTPQEEAALSSAIGKSLGYPFTFQFKTQPDRIVAKNGKFESIMSEVSPTASGQHPESSD